MTRVEQKREELVAVNLLRQILRDFPDGEISATDEPLDVLVTSTSGQRVGIEVTLFVRDRSANGSHLDSFQQLTREIAEECESAYRKRGAVPVYAAMFFARELVCRSRDIPRWADQIAHEVARVAPDVTLPAELNDESSALPVGVEKIVVYGLSSMPEAHFAPVYSDFYGELRASDVQAILASKETRTPSYRRKCDVLWLLIVVDSLKMSAWVELTEGLTGHAYVTSFDRVLVLYKSVKVVDLRVLPRSD